MRCIIKFKLFRSGVRITLLAVALPASAAVAVTDDAGKEVSLPNPARRIVSLAPHATELLFAAGAGSSVVGVSQYSDFPTQARSLPMVGGSNTFDIEKILSLKPDIAVVWRSGNSAERVAKLRAVGIPVFESEPRNLEEIASSIERLSRLAGTESTGLTAAEDFREKLQELERSNRDKPTVRVFYQIWRSPLMTLNGKHMVSDVLRTCGGENIFGALRPLAPTLSAEAVLESNPDVIIAAGGANDDPFALWRRFSQMEAVRYSNLFTVNVDLMNRAGPRILDGAELICGQLDLARKKRGAGSARNVR